MRKQLMGILLYFVVLFILAAGLGVICGYSTKESAVFGIVIGIFAMPISWRKWIKKDKKSNGVIKKRSNFLAICGTFLVINFGVAVVAVVSSPCPDFISFANRTGMSAGSFETKILLWLLFSSPGMAIVFAIVLLKYCCDGICGFVSVCLNLNNGILPGKK